MTPPPQKTFPSGGRASPHISYSSTAETGKGGWSTRNENTAGRKAALVDLPKGSPIRGEPMGNQANQPQTWQCISNTRGSEHYLALFYRHTLG